MPYVEFEGTLEECKEWWRKRGADTFYAQHQRDMSEVRASQGRKTLGTIKVYWRSRRAKTSVWVEEGT